MAEVVFGWAVRTRAVKYTFWTDEDVCELPALTRFVFIGLFAVADREGRFPDRPKKIKRLLFPGDALDVCEAMGALELAGFLVRYVVDGMKLVQIRNFAKHQFINRKEKASTLPPPAGTVLNASRTVPTPAFADLEQEGDCSKGSQNRQFRAGITELSGGTDGTGTARSGVDIESPPKQKRAGSQTAIPSDWLPNAKHQTLADELGVDLAREAEAMVDWAVAEGKRCVDWNARFSGWLRRAQTFRRSQKPTMTRSERMAHEAQAALEIMEGAHE